MKKLPILGASVALALLAACNPQKPYTISGGFDLPKEFDFGDTVYTRPDLDGHYVYLLDLDGEFIDSSLVVNEKFSFSGSLAKDEEPYFVYIADEYAVGLCVIEPGDIHVMISEEVTSVGTPQNDVITDFSDAMHSLDNEMLDRMKKAAEIEPSMSIDDFMQKNQAYAETTYENLVDSIYKANPKSLAAVYVIYMKTAQIQLADELQKELDKYDPYIRESPLLQSRMKYLRLLENYYSSSQYEMVTDESEEK